MYQILEVPVGAAELTEQMGTKYKFWYQDSNYGLCLFKEGRPGTGENWAEKIACELASLINIPHAHYEFAQFQNKCGVVTPSLVVPPARLIHGNEILARFVTGNSNNISLDPLLLNPYKRRDHTIGRVISYFQSSKDIKPPIAFICDSSISDAMDVFFGYLMFDVWIGNQDRHDQNWAVLKSRDSQFSLAPSYDHGSSMGRQETDRNREIKLTTKDLGQNIEKYCASAKSALYVNSSANKSMSSNEVLAFICTFRPMVMRAWKDRLASVSKNDVISIINKVSGSLMTEISKEFTSSLLEINKRKILK